VIDLRVRQVLNVVRQDFLNVRRASLLRAVLGLYVLFAVLVFTGARFDPDGSVSLAIEFTVILGLFFIPLVALLAGYLAVAGERESGTIRFLLGYPVSRGEVVVGKLLSRLGLIAAAVVIAFLVGCLIVVGLYDQPQLPLIGVFALLTVLFAGSYVGMAIGVSATSATRGRAMTKTVAVYFLFTLLWSRVGPITVPQVVRGAVDTAFDVQLSGPAWRVFQSLSPAEAYFNSLQLLPNSNFGGGGQIGGGTVVVIMLGWVLLPPAIGYVSLSRADIE